MKNQLTGFFLSVSVILNIVKIAFEFVRPLVVSFYMVCSLVETQKQSNVIDRIVILFLCLGAVYLFVSFINGGFGFFTFLGILMAPFFYKSVVNYLSYSKMLLNIYLFMGLIIILVYLIGVIESGFLLPSISLYHQIQSTLDIMLYWGEGENTLNWRSTDVYSVLSIFLVAALLVLNSKIMRLVSIGSVLFVYVYLMKAIAVLSIVLFVLMYSLTPTFRKYMITIMILALNVYPFLMVSEYMEALLQQKEIDLILSLRGQIWLSALSMLEGAGEYSWKFLFGVGKVKPEIPLPFSNTGEFIEVSYHSGLLRLFVMNGYIFYFISINAFILFVIWTARVLDEFHSNLLYSYVASFSLFLVSDGSLFFQFSYYLSLFIPIGMIVGIHAMRGRQIRYFEAPFNKYKSVA